MLTSLPEIEMQKLGSPSVHVLQIHAPHGKPAITGDEVSFANSIIVCFFSTVIKATKAMHASKDVDRLAKSCYRLTLNTVRCSSFCCGVAAVELRSIADLSSPSISSSHRPTSDVINSRPCSPKLCTQQGHTPLRSDYNLVI